MATIKEIEERLKTIEQPDDWIKSLQEDSRIGVQKALVRWQRQYDKRKLMQEAHNEKIAFDQSFANFEGANIAGVDEAGRGPLAGPVVSAVVILPEEVPELVGLDDSKAISKRQREQFAEKVKEVAISYTVHIQSAEQIDRLNIFSATKASMEKAVKQLTVRPDFVIVDAVQLNIDLPTKAVVQADAKSLAVAAASIIAKTTRDELMEKIHEEYPMYNFKQNAGYGTLEHVSALRSYGPCPHHRKSFEPVKSMIQALGIKQTQ